VMLPLAVRQTRSPSSAVRCQYHRCRCHHHRRCASDAHTQACDAFLHSQDGFLANHVAVSRYTGTHVQGPRSRGPSRTRKNGLLCFQSVRPLWKRKPHSAASSPQRSGRTTTGKRACMARLYLSGVSALCCSVVPLVRQAVSCL
jgi:hypothetical protein